MALLEVLISAMLVSLIAIALVTGFTNANRATADARAHAQALLCAQQDEERLRGLSEVELAELTASPEAPHELNEACQEWKTGDAGTTFTLTSTATYVAAASNEATSCATSGASANYVRTASSVTWPALGKRRSVKESSIVTTPNGGSLIAKVLNQVDEPVLGATIRVSTPEFSTSRVTGASGCVIFGALPVGEVKVSAEKAGAVGPEGAAKLEKSLTTSAGTSIRAEFSLAEPGSITVKFKTKGTGTSFVEGAGDTFVALQEGIERPVSYDLGGKAGSYVKEVTLSGLYPFATPADPPSYPSPTPSPYIVWAGDCEKNNPAKVTTSPVIQPQHADVEAGKDTIVEVEVPKLSLTVYEGTALSGALANQAAVSVTNAGCAGIQPNNLSAAEQTVRTQETNSSGELPYPDMPYGEKLELCVSKDISGAYHIVTDTFAITAQTGASFKIALRGSNGTGEGVHSESHSGGCA